MSAWEQPWPDPQALGEQAWTLQAAAAINRAMQSLILRCPAQYLWGYHRYKQPRTTP
jgi:KDO2-lipid IV(A) lauroyltransferase